MENQRQLPDDVASHLRRLTHDLGNAVEAILQAAYLLEQAKLEANPKKWAQVIDKSAQDAARINREIRKLLEK